MRRSLVLRVRPENNGLRPPKRRVVLETGLQLKTSIADGRWELSQPQLVDAVYLDAALTARRDTIEPDSAILKFKNALVGRPAAENFFVDMA